MKFYPSNHGISKQKCNIYNCFYVLAHLRQHVFCSYFQVFSKILRPIWADFEALNNKGQIMLNMLWPILPDIYNCFKWENTLIWWMHYKLNFTDSYFAGRNFSFFFFKKNMQNVKANIFYWDASESSFFVHYLS
jgi:hypothetical protein